MRVRIQRGIATALSGARRRSDACPDACLRRLLHGQFLSIKRTTQTLADPFGAPGRGGTIACWVKRTALGIVEKGQRGGLLSCAYIGVAQGFLF